MKTKITLTDLDIVFDRCYDMENTNLEQDIKDSIICAFNNVFEWPSEAQENLLSAIKEIEQMKAQDLKGVPIK